MTTKWQWAFRRIRRKIWFSVTLYGLLGLATALAAALMRDVVPESWAAFLGAGSVETILTILASSMLAVTTFSLSIMVATLASAASAATPRATQLLKDDPTTRRVLATFVGAFIFSLVGIIGLQTGLYGSGGRVILFAVTLGVVALIIIDLLRWIAHLADYGRLSDTTARIEAAAVAALGQRMKFPYLGGIRLDAMSQARFDEQGAAVTAKQIGYVQMVDTTALQALAKEIDAQFAVLVLPGTLVHTNTPLVHVLAPAPLTDAQADCVREAVVVDALRSFDQDPRFAILTLTEIASRALSPAVNDPGTAIDILGRQVRILSLWADGNHEPVQFDRLYIPALQLDDLMADAFAPIARDGASIVELQIRLQKALLALAGMDASRFGRVALTQSDRAMALADAALVLDADKAVLRDLCAALRKAATAGA